MKAIVYNGPRDVGVRTVPDARVERSTDALVKITATNICGSDLHRYEGRTDVEHVKVLGHEDLGELRTSISTPARKAGPKVVLRPAA